MEKQEIDQYFGKKIEEIFDPVSGTMSNDLFDEHFKDNFNGSESYPPLTEMSLNMQDQGFQMNQPLNPYPITRPSMNRSQSNQQTSQTRESTPIKKSKMRGISTSKDVSHFVSPEAYKVTNRIFSSDERARAKDKNDGIQGRELPRREINFEEELISDFESVPFTNPSLNLKKGVNILQGEEAPKKTLFPNLIHPQKSKIKDYQLPATSIRLQASLGGFSKPNTTQPQPQHQPNKIKIEVPLNGSTMDQQPFKNRKSSFISEKAVNLTKNNGQNCGEEKSKKMDIEPQNQVKDPEQRQENRFKQVSSPQKTSKPKSKIQEYFNKITSLELNSLNFPTPTQKTSQLKKRVPNTGGILDYTEKTTIAKKLEFTSQSKKSDLKQKKLSTLGNFVQIKKRKPSFWENMGKRTTLKIMNFLNINDCAQLSEVSYYFYKCYSLMWMDPSRFNEVDFSNYSETELVVIHSKKKFSEDISKIFKGKNFRYFVKNTRVKYIFEYEVGTREKRLSVLEVTPRPIINGIIGNKNIHMRGRNGFLRFQPRFISPQILDTDLSSVLENNQGFMKRLVLSKCSLLKTSTFHKISLLNNLQQLYLIEMK